MARREERAYRAYVSHEQRSQAGCIGVQSGTFIRGRVLREVAMADFETAAESESQGGLASEFWYFLKHSKKWWLLPVVVILLAFGVLVFLSGTAAAPFIYTLF